MVKRPRYTSYSLKGVVISLLIVIIIFMSIGKGITASNFAPSVPSYSKPSALLLQVYFKIKRKKF